MGTKQTPGEFDCIAAAEPNEPMFVLLGRDPHAAPLVRAWANEREDLIRSGGKPVEDMHKVWEARDCADAMDAFRATWTGSKPAPAPSAPEQARKRHPGRSKGGKARAAKLSPDARSAIAKGAASKRWAGHRKAKGKPGHAR